MHGQNHQPTQCHLCLVLLLCSHVIRLYRTIYLDTLPTESESKHKFRVSYVPLSCDVSSNSSQCLEACEDVSHPSGNDGQEGLHQAKFVIRWPGIFCCACRYVSSIAHYYSSPNRSSYSRKHYELHPISRKKPPGHSNIWVSPLHSWVDAVNLTACTA